MAASLGRTEELLHDLSEQVAKMDGIENVIAIDGISLLDNSASLANAGVLYVMFKDWSVRGKKEDLLPLYNKLNDIAQKTLNAKVLVMVPPPIQGLGTSGGFQMQVELQDGSFDYRKLQTATDQIDSLCQSTAPIATDDDFISCLCPASFSANR